MKKDKIYLQHIYEAAGYIESFIGSMERDEFFKNNLVQSAVIRQLEIIGEAVKNLSGVLRRKYKEIPWSDIAGLRDKLIHGYFGVDLELVWKISTKNIPELRSQISKILVEINSGD
ncbi:MAG: DUF86 domain-containing protein [candidate division Zixibacteria bacterium]|nr:DUF86 domain-containing protein [candidate division Zixibacteria bacterium]